MRPGSSGKINVLQEGRQETELGRWGPLSPVYQNVGGQWPNWGDGEQRSAERGNVNLLGNSRASREGGNARSLSVKRGGN